MRNFGWAMIAIVGFAGPVLAEDVTSDEFVAACQSNSNLPESVCACMADKVMTDEYNETQRRWLVLTLSDSEEAQSLIAEMSPAEAAGAAMFMVNQPRRCVTGG
jgi:hypothetical protein